MSTTCKALTESGQLQEFRDQDKIMLKVEQVDLLAGDNDDSGGMIPLADSGEIEPISDEQQRIPPPRWAATPTRPA
jgi:hypothetical protein